MSRASKWQTFGDINLLDYGGGFWRMTAPRVFQFIELVNMDEACGRDNEGQPRYTVELALVDLNAIPEKELESARKSCGWDSAPDNDSALAEMVYQYGLRAPLGSWSGNNAGKLLRNAKSEAHALLDSSRLADQLDKPVNAIGSTASEYMRGDIHSAMVRGIEAGDQSARIMGKMHGLTDSEMSAAALKSATVVVLKQSDIRRCRFTIMLPEHYRQDGTCKCDDAAHRAMMISEWEYSEADFAGIPLREDT
jgi:hypothetical protein